MRLRPAVMMLAPFTLLLLAVFVYPVARAGVYAGQSPDGRFVGLGNFAAVLTDRAFLFSLVNTVAFALLFVGLLVPLSLGLALLLDRRSLRWRGAWRALFFSSYLVGPVYLAVIVTLLVGGGGRDLLSIPWLAMPIVLAASLWSAAGYAMVYVLAALQSVDEEQIDAARIDGAGRWGVFWHVTLPTVTPTLAYVALVAAVGGLQLFELPFVLFQGAGPGNAALTLSMVLFSAQFEQADPGRASAIGWLMALVVTGFSALLLKASTSRALGGGAV